MYQNSRLVRRAKLSSGQRRAGQRVAIAVLLMLDLVILALWLWHNSQQPTTNAKTAKPAFNKSQQSISDPTSPWIVVNKQRPLNPVYYGPSDLTRPNVPLRGEANASNMQLRAEAASALELLVAAAKQDGLNLMLASGYRSYDTQKIVYDSEVRGYGQAFADTESARPGHSEHQTGWAADLAPTSKKCIIEACFADTPEGKWLAANAYKYGFILRYVPGKEAVTGYNYEPWHIRYIGTILATELHRVNVQTLEEFFGLEAAAEY